MSRGWRLDRTTAATVLLVALPWLVVARSGAQEDPAVAEDPTAQHWETRFEREFSAPYLPQNSHDLLLRDLSLAGAPSLRPPAAELERRRAAREPQALKASGGDDRTEGAVTAAIEWLVRTQEDDGSWPAGELPLHRVGVTGLATQVFLARGHHQADPEYGHVVRRALRFLISCQDRDGRFHSKPIPRSMRTPEPEPERDEWPEVKPLPKRDIGSGDRSVYDQIIAVETLAEASRLMATKPTVTLRVALDRGAMHLAELQNPYLGWRYGRSNADNDTCVTSWATVALATAKDAGAIVPYGQRIGGLKWLDKMTGKSGAIGYRSRGGSRPERRKPHPRTHDGAPEHPFSRSVQKWEWAPANTAIGSAARQRASASFEAEPASDKSIALLLRNLPRRVPTMDFFYLYWGTRAVRPVGGKEWLRWRQGLIPALLVTHDTDGGPEHGSWHVSCLWENAGPVYSTALAALCLTECYREPELKKR